MALLAVALAVAVATPPLILGGAIGAAIAVIVVGVSHPRVLLGALIFAVPFSRWTKIEVGPSAVTAADLLLAVLAGTWIIQGIAGRGLQIHVRPTVIAGSVLLAAAWLSALFAADFPAALGELVKLAEMIMIAVYATSFFQQRPNAIFAARMLVIAAASESFVALVQTVTASGPAGFALGSFVRAYGDFDQPNVLGGYLAMILPFGVALSLGRFRGRGWMFTATGLCALALGATLSRGAWVGTLLGLALMAALWNEATRRLLVLSGFVGAMLVAAGLAGIAPRTAVDRLSVLTENFVIFDARTVQTTPENFSLVERMAHWQAGWAMGLDHPITGVGPGNYEESYDRYYLPGWPFALGHAHNIYLNVFAELGAVGLGAFLLFLVTVFRRALQIFSRTPRTDTQRRVLLLAALGAVTAFSAHNLFDNMFVHGIGIQLGLILGLVEGESLGSPQREHQVAHRD